MKKIIAILILIAGVSFGQHYSASIDSASAKSDVFYVAQDDALASVVIDTPWTAANITFLRWDPTIDEYCKVTDQFGSEIEYTVGSLTTPTMLVIKPQHAYVLFDSLKIVSKTSGSEVNQADARSLGYILKRLTN